MSKSITLVPHMSEKAYGLSEKRNVYVFIVPQDINRHQVADAVIDQYKVNVSRVRIAHIPGKTTSRAQKGGRKSTSGKRKDIRKAYVTLAEGNKLPIFAAVEAEEKAVAEAEEKAKVKAEKQSKKEKK